MIKNKGNIWVFSNQTKVQYDTPTNITTYCDKTTYLFAFWSIIASYIALAFILSILILTIFCFLIVRKLWIRKK